MVKERNLIILILNLKQDPWAGYLQIGRVLRISDLFPEINDVLRYINETFNKLSKGLESATDSLIKFIDLLQAKINAPF